MRNIIFNQHQYEQCRQPSTYFHICNGRRSSRGRRNTYLLDDVFFLGINNRGITLSITHAHTHSPWRIGNRAVIISAINQIIPLPEGRGRIARSVLLQGIGVGLPDPDLLVLVCKSILSLPTSKEHMWCVYVHVCTVNYVFEWEHMCIKKTEIRIKEIFFSPGFPTVCLQPNICL